MFKELISLFYPEKCPGCSNILVKGETTLCFSCRNDLPINIDNNEVELKLLGRAEVDFTIPFLKFRKNGMVQSIIHEIKYAGNKDLARVLGSWFYQSLVEHNHDLGSYNYLVPVPIHWKKRLNRGYNQSEEIAKGISKASGIPLEPGILKKSFNTKSQTHKSRDERILNVKDSFEVDENAQLKHKKLIIIDDVFTTGATIETCVNLLLQHHAASVGVLVLAETA